MVTAGGHTFIRNLQWRPRHAQKLHLCINEKRAIICSHFTLLRYCCASALGWRAVVKYTCFIVILSCLAIPKIQPLAFKSIERYTFQTLWFLYLCSKGWRANYGLRKRTFLVVYRVKSMPVGTRSVLWRRFTKRQNTLAASTLWLFSTVRFLSADVATQNIYRPVKVSLPSLYTAKADFWLFCIISLVSITNTTGPIIHFSLKRAPGEPVW